MYQYVSVSRYRTIQRPVYLCVYVYVAVYQYVYRSVYQYVYRSVHHYVIMSVYLCTFCLHSYVC